MKQSTKGILAYLVIAVSLAWILWAIPLRLGVAVRSPRFQLFAIPDAFAPAIAAIIVRKWITREGFADAGLKLRLDQFRYYLIALLIPYVVMAVIIILAAALRIGYPDFTLHRALLTLSNKPPPHLSPYISLILPIQLALPAILATPILWGEEFGWPGYL